MIKYRYDTIIADQLKVSLQYVENIEKIKFCQTAINAFLEKHPEIQNDFPKIDFKEKDAKVIDCNALFSDCSDEMRKEETLLNNYYNEAIEKLNKKSSIPDNNKEKKKWGFFRKKK